MRNYLDIVKKLSEESNFYFDKLVRRLPKDSDGRIDTSKGIFYDNDIDAFRHAYGSGALSLDFGERTADLLGRINEDFNPADAYSNSRDPRSKNMDLWNNAVGRKYALKFKDRESLAKALAKALEQGELITDLEDKRTYNGKSVSLPKKNKHVIVLKQNNSGRNEVFLDTKTKEVLEIHEFLVRIESGQYPGYSVKTIKGIPTPLSKRASRPSNNLG